MDATLRRLSPLSGVIFAVLYFAGLLLAMKGSPEFVGKPADIQSYYEGTTNHHVALGGFIAIVATPFWLLFLGNLRSAMGQAEGGAGRLSATAFGAGVAAAATGTAGMFLNTVAALRGDQTGHINAAVATTLFDATQVLVYSATMALLSAFALCVGVAAVRYGAVVPKWLGFIFIILAIPMVLPMISWAVLPLGLLLTVVLSIALYRQRAGEL
ncbi:MAG TPA: hypothetical protein VM093_08495 [Aeromicrobium sp.]|nr:hypothetical protein [Aeromicrobium sp.]